MANNIYMKAQDTLAANQAECFVTIDGNRYSFMQAKKLEAKFEKNKKEVSLLGKVMVGNKATSAKGTGSATFYYCTSIMRDLLRRYKETGEDVYFDIQISNEDETSGVGRQTVILKDCNTDGGILAAFDAEGDILEEDMDFTYEDFEMPEEFTLLDGMLG